MASYRFGFFRHLLNSSGQPATCLQHVIEICRARYADRAVEAAKHRYARRFGVRDWQLYADSIELEMEAPRTNPDAANAPARHRAGGSNERHAAASIS
ncbi:MAG: hypothetical protein M5U07_15240 [Xanthobacteraceae bacterium]|nr:hypothetical protein [Xanthobacteraceae bacterium]PWB64259.1 MAG: hypothetical protein C3F17_07550 [Bradyrhizobiaceae bacterium]GIK80609.1 MAG: hypothetical protein BroJett024_17140 [Alphaproteobacteria bacterium]